MVEPTVISPAAPARDRTLDVLKGIGIILMVVGHSGSRLTNVIYLFHMALFFMASGYVWNDSKVRDLRTLGKSLLARVRGLWLPFAVGNGIFTMLNNVFVSLGLYPPEKRLTAVQTAVELVKNLLLAGETRFGGATWFLRTLFMVSAVHLVVRYIACRIKHERVFFGAVIVLTLIGAEVINRTRWVFPMGAQTVFCGYAAFLLGMLARRVRIPQRWGRFAPLASLGALVLLLLLSRVDNIGLGLGNISSLPFFFVVTAAGWILVWGVSSLTRDVVADALAYCGRHTMWVVMLHFAAFKVVAYGYLLATGGDMSGLAAFPVYEVVWLPPVYTVAGVLLPLALEAVYIRIKRGIRSLRK